MRTRRFEGMENVEGNRKLLVKSFADLRRQGLIARTNFMCCQNCAGSAIADSVSKVSKEKAAKVKGCVFWHHQDEEDIRLRGNLSLAYGDLDSNVHGKVGLTNEEVGKMVVETLKKRGLKVEWNGDVGTRIRVDLTQPTNVGSDAISKPKKKVLMVTGKWDGNVFAIMGNTKRALRDAGVPQEKISQVLGECTKGDYSHAVATCMNALEEAGYEVR